MFEGYVTPLLKRLLNRYLHDVDVDQIPLLGGDIVITNVSLRVDVIQSLIPIQLPFEISSGVVKTLTVRIPWTGLQSSSIQVELNQVEITLHPWETRRRRSSFGSTTSLPSTMSWPEEGSHRPSDASSYSAASAANVAGEVQEGSEAGASGKESWTMSLLSSLLHNISVDIKNAVLRFETPTCVLSLTFKQLLFHRTDASWQAAYSEPSGASKCTRSIINATDVAICVDPIIGKRRHFEEPVISRMKVVVRMTQFGTPLLRGGDVDIDTFHIILNTVSICLTPEQCSAIIHIATKLAPSNSSSESPARANCAIAAPSNYSLEPSASHSPSPQLEKRPQQPVASKKGGWLQSAWLLLQEEDATAELNDQGQPVPLVKAPPGSCLRVSVSKLSIRLRGPVGAGPSPAAIASTVFESSALEFERVTMLDMSAVTAGNRPDEARNVASCAYISKNTCQSQLLLSIGSIMIFGTSGCAVFDCAGSAASAVTPPMHASEPDSGVGSFGSIYSALGGIRPSRERTALASACSSLVFGHRVIWEKQSEGAGEAAGASLSCHAADAAELLLRCCSMNVSLQPQTAMFLQTFCSLVEFHPADEDGNESGLSGTYVLKVSAAPKQQHADWICTLLESSFASVKNQLFWLDIGTCSIVLPFAPTPQHASGSSLVAATDRVHFASSYSPHLIENDHRDVLAEFFSSSREPMSLSIHAGSFSLRLEHNASTEVQQLLLPFSVQGIIMHKSGSSTLSASITSLQVSLSERSTRQLQLLCSVWLQQFFHLQSNIDHQYHSASALSSAATGAGVRSPSLSSTDVRAQMIELHCSYGPHDVEVQLSLKAMEATGLVTVVPAPLAPHIVEAPKHLFALFGRKTIAASVDTDAESCGGWKWKSSMGGCNIELLQHTMAPWAVLDAMLLSHAMMADAAQRIRASDAYRSSPWLMKRSLSHTSSSLHPRTPAHQHGDVVVDLPVQSSLDTRKENDSLRLLLGSYESHFARMRQQLQQLLPSGLISRDMDVLPFSSSKSSSASFSPPGLSSFFERCCPAVFARTRKRDAVPGGNVWFRSVRGGSNRLLVLILVYIVCLHILTAWLYIACGGKSSPQLPSLKLPDVFQNK